MGSRAKSCFYQRDPGRLQQCSRSASGKALSGNEKYGDSDQGRKDMYKACIFDLDGTIADTGRIYCLCGK